AKEADLRFELVYPIRELPQVDVVDVRSSAEVVASVRVPGAIRVGGVLSANEQWVVSEL
ncbi:hypothetical protein TorRG33x02_118930, partial [Trema orientale]